MKKGLLIIGSVILLASCGGSEISGDLDKTDSTNTSEMVSTKDYVDSASIAKLWCESHADTNSKTYFYEYTQVLKKGEKGTVTSKNLLHKGDHISIDFVYSDEEGNEIEDNGVIVEITTEAKEVKVH